MSGRRSATSLHRSGISVPLFSLDNADSSEMLLAWEQRMERQLGRPPVGYVAELKIDGLAVVLTYRDGVLFTGRHER